ncbi:MAG: penicillin-binding transpeptidase domain-containing protein [Terracidiphilus sp.]
MPRMVDTRGVRSARLMAIAVVLLAGACCCRPQPAPNWTAAVENAAYEAPDARIVVLDIGSGRVLAAEHLEQAARTLAAPGSTLKPLVLYGLVAKGRWDPARRVACSRKLRIGGRSLDCSHPAAGPMDARQALAWSCNTYFATVAATLAPGELRSLLAPTGLLAQTGLAGAVPGMEAMAEFREPATADQRSLALLGVDGIRVTPLELASAYRWLAMQLAEHADIAATEVVRLGLQDSASFGMAGAASSGGVPIAGKTGTASVGPGTGSHGWFVGLAPAEHPTVVVAIYLPAGRGTDAARVAAQVLGHSPLKAERR